MSQVGPDCVADYGRLGFQPTDPMREAVELQPQERTQRQGDVVALRLPRPRLAPLHLGTLLDPAVVVLNGPAVLRVLLPRQVGQRQVTAGPVGNVAVWGDDLEYP